MKVQSLTKKFMLLLVCFTMLFTMSLLAGCKGDNGASGANGATGATGPAGPVTTTNESCMVCHKTGALADVAVMHPDNTNEGLIVTVTSVENVGGFPKVNFMWIGKIVKPELLRITPRLPSVIRASR